MSKIPSPHFQMEMWAIGFFNFLFDKTWSRIYLTYLFLLNYDLFWPSQNYKGQNYQNVAQVSEWKITICPVLSIFLYDLLNKTWFFENFIFEIESSYSFKITCILVRQLIPLKKNNSVFGKIYFLISLSHICTPLILASASVKMAGTSATVM